MFAIFLTLYLLTLLENAPRLVFLVCSHSELHKPMYFFLGQPELPGDVLRVRDHAQPARRAVDGPCHVPFPACLIQLLFVSH